MRAADALRLLTPPALLVGRDRLRSRWRSRHSFAELEPFSLGYLERRGRLLRDVIGRVRAGATLAEAGVLDEPDLASVDERPLEYAWALARLRDLRETDGLLDVGCVLNQRFCAEMLAELFAERWYVNLAYEPLHDRGRASMIVCDVRDCPLPDGSFGAVTCLSTLEHVGMDNTLYVPGSPLAAADESGTAEDGRRRALTELVRLLAPGGTLLLTVPFGEPEDKGWFSVFGGEDVARTCDVLGRRGCAVEFFRADRRRGWIRCAEGEDGRGLRYGDGVPAAAAVACIEFRKAA
jgi:SAM-dependent methyltransferase